MAAIQASSKLPQNLTTYLEDCYFGIQILQGLYRNLVTAKIFWNLFSCQRLLFSFEGIARITATIQNSLQLRNNLTMQLGVCYFGFQFRVCYSMLYANWRPHNPLIYYKTHIPISMEERTSSLRSLAFQSCYSKSDIAKSARLHWAAPA